MGINDRDYMRDRYRERRGIPKATSWNDKKGRVEGAWFSANERGHDNQKDRWRQRDRGPSTPWAGSRGRSKTLLSPPRLQGLVLILCALPIAIGAFREAKREGWLPDTRPEYEFPASGDVTVNENVDPRDATSQFSVATDKAHAVAQLFDLDGGHVISVYVRRGSEVTTSVPPGVYRLKVAEGQRWFGLDHFFGNSMTYETVVKTMRFTRRQGAGIDLHRRPGGELLTRPSIDAPSFGENGLTP